MFKNKVLLVLALLAGLTVTGFQCASTELTSAKLYIQQNNYDKALEALQREVQKNPQSDEGYYLLGFVYGEQGKYEEMTDAFSKSLAASKKFEPNISDYQLKAYVDLFTKGVTFYNRSAGTQNEDSIKIYLDKSLEAFQNTAKVAPDSADPYMNIASIYIRRGDLEGAVAPLQTLIQHSHDAEGYNRLGNIYYDEGRQLMNNYQTSGNARDSVQAMEYFNKAITLLEEGKTHHPSNPDLLVILSSSYVSAGKSDVAIEAFRSLVEQNPENPSFRFNYGVVLLEANQYQMAEEQFKKAVDLKPDYNDAVYNLALTYVRWGSALSKEAEEKEDNSGAYKSKFEQALPYLEQVVSFRQDEPAIWELLGRVYTILGMTDKATDAFGKADSLRQ